MSCQYWNQHTLHGIGHQPGVNTLIVTVWGQWFSQSLFHLSLFEWPHFEPRMLWEVISKALLKWRYTAPPSFPRAFITEGNQAAPVWITLTKSVLTVPVIIFVLFTWIPRLDNPPSSHRLKWNQVAYSSLASLSFSKAGIVLPSITRLSPPSTDGPAFCLDFFCD